MKKLIKIVILGFLPILCNAQDEYIKSLINELNLARQNPSVYGEIIEVDLSYIQPKSKLTYSSTLSNNACIYLDYMISNYDDLVHSGYEINESLALTYPNKVIRDLIEDDGIEDLGHRHHLLSYAKGASSDSMIGICYRKSDYFNYVIIWTK